MMSSMLMCRTCGAYGDPYAPRGWLDLKHLSDACVRVQARRDGEAALLHYGDRQRVWDAYRNAERIPVSLDLGYRMGVTYDGMLPRRAMLEWLRDSAGGRVRFVRRHTTQGAPVFMVETDYSNRIAIGIGDTWTDAVARALDMWAAGT